MRSYLGGDKTKGVATIVEVPNLDVARYARRRGCRRTVLLVPSRSTPRRPRNWEQGRTRPDGAARVLLTVIDRDPEAVLEALRIGAKPAPARATRARIAASG
jgi:putative transcriptional regulator